jgi:hypothetical protein
MGTLQIICISEGEIVRAEITGQAISRRKILKILGAVAPSALVSQSWALSHAALESRLKCVSFACSPQNDLYKMFCSAGIVPSRMDNPEDAVARAPAGSGVLILADAYPDQPTKISPELFQQATAKKLRLYLEYPSTLPGLAVGRPQGVDLGKNHNLLERGVVAANVFGPSLERMRILELHDCRYVPVAAPDPILVLARVAGFDMAVYGLPQSGVQPILVRHPEYDILVGTTKLSGFIRGRYAPAEAWAEVWKWIMRWLCEGNSLPVPQWTPAVRPLYGRNERLPDETELTAFQNGISWFSRAKLFVAPSWPMTDSQNPPGSKPPLDPANSWPLGDGSDGVLEGFASIVEWDGKQPVGWHLRADCAGEVSMAMALSGLLQNKAQDSEIAANLNDFIYYRSALTGGVRDDPQSPSYGLIGWSLPGYDGVYYGDDNARSMLGTMVAAALLASDKWNMKVLRSLLANLRTTGTFGFRQNALTDKELGSRGWRYYYDQPLINYHPHYQAYPWACYLRAYDLTHYEPFLNKAETAIRMTMGAYPDQWRWTNGFQQERARMLLPLAWLVRLRGTDESRQWLKNIATDLVAFQDSSGAIREEFGPLINGQYGPTKSNELYGTAEASLLQENGDPVCDQLYTVNFAFLGLHEAASATQDPLYSEAADRLASFLCRIQIESATHPELAGGWFRAFDFGRWDYWGSASDWGWGPWSIETGWTQSWICAVLAMRKLQTSLWALTGKVNLGPHLDALLPVLFPQTKSGGK